jgi:hypothetical protein
LCIQDWIWTNCTFFKKKNGTFKVKMSHWFTWLTWKTKTEDEPKCWVLYFCLTQLIKDKSDCHYDLYKAHSDFDLWKISSMCWCEQTSQNVLQYSSSNLWERNEEYVQFDLWRSNNCSCEQSHKASWKIAGLCLEYTVSEELQRRNHRTL